jgi:hypothetical protein
MTEQDEDPSVEDAVLASSINDEPNGTEGGSGAPASPPQESERDGRVKELMRQKQAADAAAARSAAEAGALRQMAKPAGRPQDYSTPEDYTRAVAQQATREAGADILARQAAQAQELAAFAAADAWSEVTAAFRQRVPDFDAVAHNPALPITPVMADAIRESNKGAEIAYYLGKNPTEASNIASLPPLSQATAIARLEGRLSNGQASISRAPQPISTLSGGGGSAGQRLEDMNFEDYRRARGL